jgi:hypothetical protein
MPEDFLDGFSPLLARKKATRGWLFPGSPAGIEGLAGGLASIRLLSNHLAHEVYMAVTGEA